ESAQCVRLRVRAGVQRGWPRALRPQQPPEPDGPEEMGWRVTAQNFNLNRDYTKTDAPEMQSMLRLLDAWDPVLYVDLHVTDGAQFEVDVSNNLEPMRTGDAEMQAGGKALMKELNDTLSSQGSLPIDFYPSLR